VSLFQPILEGRLSLMVHTGATRFASSSWRGTRPSGRSLIGNMANHSNSLRETPVLATWDIQPPDEAFENTQSRLLLFADSEEEEY